MNRREALKNTSALLGVTLIGAESFLSGCDLSARNDTLLSIGQINLLDTIGEVILPATEQSPGALEARVGEFMDRYVTHCYSPDEQRIFLKGLDHLTSSGFAEMENEQKTAFVSELEKEWREAGGPHYYGMIKQLTVLGYFSSEAGVTKALRYDPMPGGYDGCVPWKKGAPAWQGPLSSIG